MHLVGFIITIYPGARSPERLQHFFIFRDKYSSFPEFITFNKNGNNRLKKDYTFVWDPIQRSNFFDKETDNCYYKQSNFTCSVMIATRLRFPSSVRQLLSTVCSIQYIPVGTSAYSQKPHTKVYTITLLGPFLLSH